MGWTKPIDSKKRWRGWGWRHIAAKHGWGPDDVIATQAALLTTPQRTNNGKVLKYTGLEYTKNGVICERVVTVAPVPLHDVHEPEPKEIVTSYGSYVRPA